MTNYRLQAPNSFSEINEMPVKRTNEKREKRLALLKRVEAQRMQAYKNRLREQRG